MEYSTPRFTGFGKCRARRVETEPPPIPNARWVPLTRGLFALVDEEDFERVGNLLWYAQVGHRCIYAARNARVNGRRVVPLLHRVIMNAPDELHVDHINSDGLDCRKQNLRICTNQQNCANARTITKPKTSKYKGVSWFKRDDKWLAKIGVNGKGIPLGYYINEKDAAKRYDAAARQYFGEFARLNFPDQIEDSI